MKKLFLVLFLLGCQGKYTNSNREGCATNFGSWFQDKQTKLCFLREGHGLTQVPCTPEVLKVIEECKL